MMPTKTQCQELLYNNTNSEWITLNNVNGRKFINKTDSSKYIFFPAAGGWDGTNHNNIGSQGSYWSTSLNSYRSLAWFIHILTDDLVIRSTDHWIGNSIRPIAPKRPW